MNKEQFRESLQRYVDGIASADDVQRLNQWLRHDAEVRREFIELLNLDSALGALAESVDLDSVDAEVVQIGPKSYPNRRSLGWIIAVTCAAVLLCGAWWWRIASAPWATVQMAVGVAELADAAPLRGEPVVMRAGIVQLQTARGARIVIEAPAEFQFESAQRLRITLGRISADVPPEATGFTVTTPSGEAIDLGTRFGVDVRPAGAAEIHVFQGEVIARTVGKPTSESLRGGDAMAMDGVTTTARELRTSAFIHHDEMAELTAAFASGQRERADAANAAIRKDPALIALLDFESDEVPPGVYRMTQGRWPGSRAPEFTNIGDHMRLNVGNDQAWSQLTLAAWVRLDQLGAPFQSLLHTDGWGEDNLGQVHLGQVHWMVTRNATMRLALFGNTLAPGSREVEGFPDSQTPVLQEQGRWVHLATVYDAATATVRFYLNGKLDSETRHEIAHPARLGPAQIGNWDRNDRKLSGRIDELVLLGRALRDDEIQALYAAGCPYR